jgi:hypothetical protein
VPFTADPFGNLQRMLMPAFVLGTGLAAVPCARCATA